jgi:hypothetical protein
MVRTKADFLRKRESGGGRASKIVTAPTGQEFEIAVLDPMDIGELFAEIGIDPEKLKDMAREDLGTKLLANARTIIDKFIVPMVLDPRLLPSTADPASDPEAVPVGLLYGVEKSFLLNKLFEIATGQEGQAAAEKFRGDAVGVGGGKPGEDLRPAPE